jgi:hypothetical protein
MGRFLKNAQLDSGVLAVQLPSGRDTLTPEHPANGMMRYNLDSGTVEFYYGSAWRQTAVSGTVPLVMTYLTGNGISTDFDVAVNPDIPAMLNPENYLVFISGIYQQPTLHYDLVDSSGWVLRFVEAPPAADIYPGSNNITVIYGMNSTLVP